MDIVNSINIRKYHKCLIEKYGLGSIGALGWKAREGQETRFEMLSQIGDLNNSSVLDVGCGHGDLCGFLNKKYTRLRYIGVDLNESFLDFAIEKYSLSGETSFFLGDFTKANLPVTDYIIASGTLNYYNSDPNYVFKTITKLFNGCRIAFGFNILSKVDNFNSLLIAYKPQQILEHCRTLTSNIIFKEGYYENDFTVMMYR